MMQVQQIICVQEGACTFQLNILAREDANDAERAVAQAVEGYLVIVMRQIAESVGASLEVIGPQYQESEPADAP